MTNIANEAEIVGQTHSAQKQLGANYVPTVTPQQQQAQKMAVVTGQPTFWGRIQQVGIGEVKKLDVTAKMVAGSHSKNPTAFRNANQENNQNNAQVKKNETGNVGKIVNAARDVGNGLKSTAVSTVKDAARVPADITMDVANPIERATGQKTLTSKAVANDKNAPAIIREGAKLGANGTLKQTVGDVVQTATLATPEGKVVEVTGEDLLKTFGTQGVKDLSEKAGIETENKGAIEGARELAKTKMAQDAYKKATTSAAGRAAKSSLKTGATFGTYNAAQAASNNESGKKIVKAGVTGAVEGAVAGATGSLLKSGVKALKDTKEGTTSPPVRSPAEKLTPVKAKESETEVEQGREQNENKTKSASNESTTSKLTQQVTKPVRKGMGEEGAVAPGQAVKDVQDLIEKHQATTRYSGDIQRGGDEVEGAKKQISSDAVKVAKAQPKLSAIDKQILQNYRDAKEAGLPHAQLPERLKQADEDITSLNKAAFSAKKEQAQLEGREYSDEINPETYVHREAQGKGSIFDQISQGSKRNASGTASFGKRTSSDKGRVFQAVTDAQGKRQVVAVKNESFGKVKHLTGFDGNQKPIQLGKHTYDADSEELTNSKGEKLKLGQATTEEITKATGQKYYTDPQLTSLKNYVDSRSALENVKYIESIKNHPDFEKFASAPGETAPKNYETVHGLFQFMGYKFEPKTAEALRDIVKNTSDEKDLGDKVGNLLKKTIVYFPLKHNLNQTATYAVDRGLSSLANPAAYYRGAKSLVKAFQEVTNEGPLFQKLEKAGFSMPSTDEKAFTKYVTTELKGASKDDPRIIETAKAFGTTPARLYNAVTHTAVWQYGDILNVARVIERMSPKLLSKGEDFETAMKNTEKYSLQYKVPSRVGPTKVGRSISRTLQSPKVFFGRYRYDLYKIMGNTIKDTVNLKSLVTNPKQNIQAVDKLAAMAFGAAVVWPLVDKGLQKLTGNPNANTTAPGALQIPELINKVRTGKESPETAAGNQLYPSPAITLPLEVQSNRDSFTGDQIYDPNASEADKMKQIGTWLKGQSSFGEKVSAGKNGSNKAVDVILGVAGTNLPKNSTGVNKLYSLQYDSLPNVQTQAKAAAKQGNYGLAEQKINAYDKQVLQAAKDALTASKVPVPSDSTLIAKLKKAGTYYAPKPSTIRSWKTKTPSNAKALLGL